MNQCDSFSTFQNQRVSFTASAISSKDFLTFLKKLHTKELNSDCSEANFDKTLDQ